MSKKEQPKPQNVWWCETCKDNKEMSHPQMIEHLKSKHGVDTKGLKCSKSMITHMDGDTWFSYQWDVRIKVDPEIQLTNATCTMRAKDDPIRYA